MEKTLIFFDQEKFESKKRFLERFADLIQGYADEFNSLTKNSEFAIKSLDDVELSLFNIIEFILRKTNEEFKIGNKTLSKEKAYELGLIDNPSWLPRITDKIKETSDEINSLYSHKMLFDQNDGSLFSCVMYDSGKVTVNPEVLSKIKEVNTYYLHESRKDEYELINKLIDLSKKRFPEMAASNFNGFLLIEHYLQSTCCILPYGNDFHITANPKVFSKP